MEIRLSVNFACFSTSARRVRSRPAEFWTISATWPRLVVLIAA